MKKRNLLKKELIFFLYFFCLYQIDCRMEVDEIYEDLKNDVLKRI